MINYKKLTVIFSCILFFLSPLLYAKKTPIDKIKKIEVTLLKDVLETRTYHPVAEVKLINQTKLAAEINAPIKTIAVLVGDKVSQEQVLITLNCHDLVLANKVQKAQLNQAKVSELYAKKEYQRAKKLAHKHSMSIENKERRESAWKQAEAVVLTQTALLKQSQNQLKKCQIRAPFAGTVTQRLSSVGDFANIGKALIEVAGELVEVSGLLNQTEIQSILKAQTLFFIYQKKSYPVKIRTVFQIHDRLTHNQEIRLIFKDKKAPAGAFGKLTWQTERHWLPTQYIHRRKSQLGYFEWNKEDQTVQFRVLEDAIEGVPVILNDPEKRLIVTKGVYNLQAGDKVELTK